MAKIGDCNGCGASDVPIKHWKFPSDENEGDGFGWDYCRACWDGMVRQANLEERGELVPDFGGE